MTESRTIKGPAARLAVGASVFGVYPTVPPLGAVKSGRILGYDLALASESSLEVEAAGSLLVDARGLDPRQRDEDEHPNRTAVEVALTTGSLRARWSEHAGSHHSTRDDARFRLERWEWRSGAAPVAWIGQLDGGADVWLGNMVTSTTVDGREVGASDCECLEGGGLRALVVRRGRRRDNGRVFDLVLEALDGEIEVERVRCLLRTLSFVRGHRVGVRVLVGVDHDLNVVAVMGVESGEVPQLNGHPRDPVPRSLLRRQTWRAELFRRLADRIQADDATDADVTHIATSAYLDSQGDHIEGAYLKLQVALEAFCVRAGEPLTDRADKARWIEWVEHHREEIGALALTKDGATTFVDSLKGQWRASTSGAVEKFFKRRTVKLPRAIRDQLPEDRGAIVHRYTLGKYSPDFERELEVIGLAQTLLVAALALYVGYEGPITDGRRWEDSPEWWPYKIVDTPEPRWIANRCVAEHAELAIPLLALVIGTGFDV